ncbi:hypothetical protein BDR22DRAFT_710997 [Usnea florida]
MSKRRIHKTSTTGPRRNPYPTPYSIKRATPSRHHRHQESLLCRPRLPPTSPLLPLLRLQSNTSITHPAPTTTHRDKIRTIFSPTSSRTHTHREKKKKTKPPHPPTLHLASCKNAIPHPHTPRHTDKYPHTDKHHHARSTTTHPTPSLPRDTVPAQYNTGPPTPTNSPSPQASKKKKIKAGSLRSRKRQPIRCRGRRRVRRHAPHQPWGKT